MRIRKYCFAIGSIIVSVASLVAQPATPGNLSHSTITNHSAILGWDASTGADGYVLRIRDQFSLDWHEIQDIVTNNLEISGLQPNHKYSWQVQAVDINGSSSFSVMDTFRTPYSIDKANGVYSIDYYNYPSLHLDSVAILDTINNLPYRDWQEEAFSQRMSATIDYFVGNYNVGNGGIYFESEKRSYPYAMYHYFKGLTDSNQSKLDEVTSFLQSNDYHVHGKTLGVDLFPSFTLKGQVPKYFYFGKYHGLLDSAYMEKMREAIAEWTYDRLSFTRAYDGYDHVATGKAIDPLGREHPAYDASTGWGPNAKNSWVDVRATDNLKAMRETSVYLFAEEIGNDTVKEIYKQRLIDHVNALYNIGYSEWDSDPYYDHSIPPFLNLFEYTKDPFMKKVAKAALDYYMATGAAKYYQGTMAGPFKRVYDANSSILLKADNVQVPYNYFGGCPVPADRGYSRDSYIIYLSDYRPPQAIYHLGLKNIPPYSEQLNTHPAYGSFNPDAVNKPSFFETMFYGKNYRLGSVVSKNEDWDLTPFGLVLHDNTRGAEPFLIGATCANGCHGAAGNDQMSVEKNGGDQIAQFRNMLIRMQPVSNGHFMVMLPDDVTAETQNGDWFFAYDSAWVGVHPVNLSLGVSEDNQKNTGYYFQHTGIIDSTGLIAMVMEVADYGQFSSFSEFKAAFNNTSLDLSRMEEGIINYTGTEGNRLRVQYNPLDDMPKVFRNGDLPYDYTNELNYSVYKTVTPPVIELATPVVLDDHVTLDISMKDTLSSIISQAWKSGKLEVVAGNWRFVSTMDENGNAWWKEDSITGPVSKPLAIESISWYAEDILLNEVTNPTLTGDDYQIAIDGLKQGNTVLKVKVRDSEGNTVWSEPVTVEVQNGDATAPVKPSGLEVFTNSESELTLNWMANPEQDVYFYRVYSGPDATFPVNNDYFVANASNPGYLHSGLESGKEYFYKIVAYDSAMNASVPSEAVSGITAQLFSIPNDMDTYVKENDPDASFYTDGGVRVKCESGNHWDTYLQFDISALPSNIGSAKIEMLGRAEIDKVSTDPDYYYPPIHVYPVSSNWDETSLTWNNSTSLEKGPSSLDSQVGESSTYKIWYSWDVTANLTDSVLAGKSKISYTFSTDGQNDPASHMWFVAQNWQPENAARLVVATGPEKVAQPLITPVSGVYTDSVTLSISCSTPGAEIFYTLDGTQPDNNADLYTGPLTIKNDATVKAIAYKDPLASSIISSANYTIVEAKEKVAMPAADNPGGSYYDSVVVSLSTSTAGATIYYTLDGNAPNTGSDLYTGPLVIKTDLTLKAMAVKAGMDNSDALTWDYVVIPAIQKVAKPEFSIAPGTYNDSVKVSISSSTEGAVVHYWMQAGGAKQQYLEPVLVTSSGTIESYASKEGMENSDTASIEIVIVKTGIPAQPGDTRIYPNPASSVLTIESAREFKGFFMINALGQEVLSQQAGLGATLVPIDHLASGIYSLQAITKQGIRSELGKVIVK